jgi:hypothetical protein
MTTATVKLWGTTIGYVAMDLGGFCGWENRRQALRQNLARGPILSNFATELDFALLLH